MLNPLPSKREFIDPAISRDCPPYRGESHLQFHYHCADLLLCGAIQAASAFVNTLIPKWIERERA